MSLKKDKDGMEVYNKALKQRIISAVVGIFILISVLCFFKTIILNIVISAISVMAVYELLLATKYIKNKLLATTCLFFVALIPCFKILYINKFVIPICTVFVFILFMIMLVKYKTVTIEQIGLAFFVSVIIPFALSTLIYIRDKFIGVPIIAMFYILLALESAWISDSGAYFVGVCFGKTKLAPNISPKKTIEGLIGGTISSTLFGLLLGLVFKYISEILSLNLEINYFRLLIILPLASIISVFGDLSASLIKRQCLIKDFGAIMPGHGGVLDRFDSVLFSVPFYYLVVLFFPLIKL